MAPDQVGDKRDPAAFINAKELGPTPDDADAGRER